MSKNLIKVTNKAEAVEFVARLQNHLNRPDFKGVTFQVVGDKPKRSVEQNKYYWGVVVQYALDYYSNNIRDLITDLMKAMRFSLTTDFIHELLKLMFNQGKTTTGLKTDEMMIYQDNIRHHFLHDYGLDIPPPNEEQIDATKSEVENEQHN